MSSAVDTLLLSAVRISTFDGSRALTNASGFFFERDERLYVVTSRHVLIDAATLHRPDRLEIELHCDIDNFAKSTGYSIPLFRNGKSLWRQGLDSAGEIDVAVIEIDREKLPDEATWFAFTPEQLLGSLTSVEIGSPLLVVGVPLGFHDTLHHLPVARHAVVASSFGLRFQGQGFFLTDARTHRGLSGAAVVMKMPDADSDGEHLPWILLGIHSARFDVGTRDIQLDERLGLNCTWYADILMTLTDVD